VLTLAQICVDHSSSTPWDTIPELQFAFLAIGMKNVNENCVLDMESVKVFM